MSGVQIPDGYERTEWSNATHALSNGQVLPVNHSKFSNNIGVAEIYMSYSWANRLGIIPIRKLPELDLSPLTKDEFDRLLPWDTVVLPGEGIVTIQHGKGLPYGFYGIHNNTLIHVVFKDKYEPTETTARRLRGEGKQ
jgi:hypothetical protein